MLLITTSISLERLVLAQLIFLVHSVAYEVRGETDNSGILQSENFISSDWDNKGHKLQVGIILENEQNVPLETKEWEHNFMIPSLRLISLWPNIINFEQDTSTSFKLLERRYVLKLFNEIYNNRNSVLEELLKRNVINSRIELVPTPKKRQVRRCGTLLIKHIQKVCNGCLRSATDSNPILMSKRVKPGNRWKRDAGISKITDICCTQRACEDDELKPYCC